MNEEKILTGYPAIDKPWLKYYKNQPIDTPLPDCKYIEYIWQRNKDRLDSDALDTSEASFILPARLSRLLVEVCTSPTASPIYPTFVDAF